MAKKNLVSPIFSFTLIALMLLPLGGCFLISEIDVVERGEEITVAEGDYLKTSSLSEAIVNLQKPDFTKFSTKIYNPDVVSIVLLEEGGFLSKSYVYQFAITSPLTQ